MRYPKPLAGNSKLTQDSIWECWMLNRGEMTPVLLRWPFNWMTILPERWSSMISNSPIYPEWSVNIWVQILDAWKCLFKLFTMSLHDAKKFDNDFGRRSDECLTLSTTFGVDNVIQAVILHKHKIKMLSIPEEMSIDLRAQIHGPFFEFLFYFKDERRQRRSSDFWIVCIWHLAIICVAWVSTVQYQISQLGNYRHLSQTSVSSTKNQHGTLRKTRLSCMGNMLILLFSVGSCSN